MLCVLRVSRKKIEVASLRKLRAGCEKRSQRQFEPIKFVTRGAMELEEFIQVAHGERPADLLLKTPG